MVQDYIIQIISNLFFIVVIMLIVDILVPDDYKHYIEIFMGICIVLMLISPILDISNDLKLQYFKKLNETETGFISSNIYSKEMYKDSLIKEYKEKLESDIKNNISFKTGKQVEIVSLQIYDNLDLKNFGQIKNIVIKGEYDAKIANILKNEYETDKQNIVFEEVKNSNGKN